MTTEESLEDGIEIEPGFSPQYATEVRKIRDKIVSHIENNLLKKAVFQISFSVDNPNPILGSHFKMSVQKMDERERSSFIKEIIKIVHEVPESRVAANSHISQVYEITIDSLFIFAEKEGVLSTTQCIEGLVMTSDFTLRSRISRNKWKFIGDRVLELDYKGIRNVLRCIMVSQIRRLPENLSIQQVGEIRIIEELILSIIDRQNNLLPSIMTLSETMREMSTHSHIMPRLSAKLTQISVHFRPIADLTYPNGRSFIYPIPQHPAFVPYASFWEIEPGNQAPVIQSHHMLPYRPEHRNPFLFTLYMILRQPRGKDSFNLSKKKTKSHWDGLVSVMICETMADAERLNETDPIPRYQWDNIANIVHFGIVNSMLNPSNFFHVLQGLVERTHYTRARDEVMWIVFQIVGTFSSNASFDEAVPEIVALYNALFAGEVSWRGASDHPALLARFLAAASTWMILEGKAKLPPPNETLSSHISFITNAAENMDPANIAMIAVLANAYRSESRVGKVLPSVYQSHLEGTIDDAPVLLLSYGKQAINKMEAFSTEFFDALTFRAKKTLMAHCFACLRTFSKDKLPSPAVFDTIARICEALDYESAANDVVMMAVRSIHCVFQAPQDISSNARDQSHFLHDFLCYRLPNLVITNRHEYICKLIGFLRQPGINNAPNRQIYQVLEQFLIRQWCWTSFHETILNANMLFGAGKDVATFKYCKNPMTFVNPADPMGFPFCPEIYRMSIVKLMKALKITGQDVILEGSTFPQLITSFPWPEKMTKYFPKWATDLISNTNMEFMQPNYAEIQQSVHKAVSLHRSLTHTQSILAYRNGVEQNVHHIFAVIYRCLYDNRDAQYPEFYEPVESMTPRDIVIATNYLVDYLIAEAQNGVENNSLFSTMATILCQMVFNMNLLRADRLLISLVMHPTCDETSHIAILIVNEFCDMHEFTARVKWFNTHVPKKEHNHADYVRRIVEYHELFPENEIIEMVKGPQREPLSEVHLPFYYGCLIDRLLPIADFIITVALEQNIFRSFNHPILQSLSLLYKYHPYPIQFIYSTLFTMYGLISKPVARTFVLTLQQQIEDASLTVSFEKFNHQQVSLEPLIMELVERIELSLEFNLTVPSFVSKDWKTAEFTPGAQTLYLSCIEIMASPHSHEAIVPAMIDVLLYKSHQRPFNIVNLIALLLTALPEDYSTMLENEFFDVLRKGKTSELSFEEVVLDNFEESLLLHLARRSMVVNVISQIYWTHCNMCLLETFARKFVPEMISLVETEKDLWYSLRLIIPVIRRYLEWQTENSKQIRSNPEMFGPLHILRLIFERLGYLAEKGITFENEECLCDLFYNCKYYFAGDFLRDSATVEFAKLPESMRDRLKFYVSQFEPSSSSSSSGKEDNQSFADNNNRNVTKTNEEESNVGQDVEMVAVNVEQTPEPEAAQPQHHLQQHQQIPHQQQENMHQLQNPNIMNGQHPPQNPGYPQMQHNMHHHQQQQQQQQQQPQLMQHHHFQHPQEGMMQQMHMHIPMGQSVIPNHGMQPGMQMHPMNSMNQMNSMNSMTPMTPMPSMTPMAPMTPHGVQPNPLHLQQQHQLHQQYMMRDQDFPM